MLKIMSVILVFALSPFAGAYDADHTMTEGDHSADVCSRVNPAVCAHVGHMTSFSSSDEVQFKAHVMTPQNQAISGFSLDLWMPGMGHGSSPVQLKQLGPNLFQVTKAYFVMPGQWVIRMRFEFGGAAHLIEVPVNITD